MRREKQSQTASVGCEKSREKKKRERTRNVIKKKEGKGIACTTQSSRSSSSWMGLIFSQEVGNVGDGVEFIQYIHRERNRKRPG
jgi:hypothetical protein